MLRDLHISDLGVIDDAHLEVATGLNVLTGETGAGKTMVVDALTLLLGERSDPGMVRAGRQAALVEARVTLEDRVIPAQILDDAGIDGRDGEVVAARQVLVGGRSRVQLQGRMSTVGTLARVMAPLVEVHGQHDFQGLLRPNVQRDLLDRFAGAEALRLRGAYADTWRRLRAVRRTLDELTSRADQRVREAEVLRYQLAEIEAADVRPDEREELEAEINRLGHAESLREAAVTAQLALAGDDEESGAVTVLGHAARQLADGGAHDVELAALAERAEATVADATDLAAALRTYVEALQADPARLAEAQERLALLRDLERKYGGDLAAVLVFAEEGAARLQDLDGGGERTEQLEAERDELAERLVTLGSDLSARRTEAAARLGTAIEAELSDLAMPAARFTVRVDRGDPDALLAGGDGAGEDGLDRIGFELAANPGAPARPLVRAASGGELSRVMLALRVVLAGIDPPGTIVFDEIDAGVGGRTAAAVGRRLAALAHHHQVLVVTHLPQIAAFADRHFVVEKLVEDGTTRTVVRSVADADRVVELSRMLSGMTESGFAKAHAEELLALAADVKASVAAAGSTSTPR